MLFPFNISNPHQINPFRQTSHTDFIRIAHGLHQLPEGVVNLNIGVIIFNVVGSPKHLLLQDKCVSSTLQLFSFGVAFPSLSGEEVALRICGVLNVTIVNGSGTVGTAGESDTVVFQRKGIKNHFCWNASHSMININGNLFVLSFSWCWVEYSGVLPDEIT